MTWFPGVELAKRTYAVAPRSWRPVPPLENNAEHSPSASDPIGCLNVRLGRRDHTPVSTSQEAAMRDAIIAKELGWWRFTDALVVLGLHNADEVRGLYRPKHGLEDDRE